MIDDCFLHDKLRLKHRDAIEILKSRLSSIAAPQTVKLSNAAARILAQSIIAPRNIPAFDNSAVDGYAFTHSDYETTGGFFPLTARIPARQGNPIHLPDTSAARIFTGAVMPQNADSVVMQEDCERHEQDGTQFVVIPPGLRQGANVRLAGEDVRKEETLMQSGSVLRPQDIAAIASCGFDQIVVNAPLKIALFSTGDEIIMPGTPYQDGQVYDANSHMLTALLASLPVEIKDLGILPDTSEAVDKALTQAADKFDIIISSGGASLGSEDHITKHLSEHGKRHMWQLAIKPGRPMCFGQLGKSVFFGLPGNPVASFVCFLLYIRPAIIALGGGQWSEPRRFKIPAGFDFPSKKPDRREFWRGYISEDPQGKPCLQKYSRDGSGLISGLRKADGFIEIAEDVTSVKQGELLDFIPFSEFGIL